MTNVPAARPPLLAGERQELGAGRRVLAHPTQQSRGHGAGSLGPGAAHAHAGVLGLDHHSDAVRRELLAQVVGDLAGEPFLGLHPAGEVVDGARQLGQPDDPVGGQVADVRDTHERQHVVLAQRPHRDVAHQHQLVVPLAVGERRHLERLRAEQLGVRLHQPTWRLGHVLVVDRETEGAEHVGCRVGGPVDLVVEATFEERSDGLAHRAAPVDDVSKTQYRAR